MLDDSDSVLVCSRDIHKDRSQNHGDQRRNGRQAEELPVSSSLQNLATKIRTLNRIERLIVRTDKGDQFHIFLF